MIALIRDDSDTGVVQPDLQLTQMMPGEFLLAKAIASVIASQQQQRQLLGSF